METRKERRQQRAVDRGYVCSARRGFRYLEVPAVLYQRVKSQRDALILHDECNRLTEHPFHFLAQAIEATVAQRSLASNARARLVNQRARDARHSWDDPIRRSTDGASSDALSVRHLCLEVLVDEPVNLEQLHIQAFNAYYGAYDSEDGEKDVVEEADCSLECSMRQMHAGEFDAVSRCMGDYDADLPSRSFSTVSSGQSADTVTSAGAEAVFVSSDDDSSFVAQGEEIIQVFLDSLTGLHEKSDGLLLSSSVEAGVTSSLDGGAVHDEGGLALHDVSFVADDGNVARDVGSVPAPCLIPDGAQLAWADVCRSDGCSSEDIDIEQAHGACQSGAFDSLGTALAGSQSHGWHPVGGIWSKHSALAEDSAWGLGDAGGQRELTRSPDPTGLTVEEKDMALAEDSAVTDGKVELEDLHVVEKPLLAMHPPFVDGGDDLGNVCSGEAVSFDGEVVEKVLLGQDGGYMDSALAEASADSSLACGAVQDGEDGLSLAGTSALAEDSAGDVALAFALAEDSDTLHEGTAVDDFLTENLFERGDMHKDDETDEDALCLGSSLDSGVVHVHDGGQEDGDVGENFDGRSEVLVPFFVPCEPVALQISRAAGRLLTRNTLDVAYSKSAKVNDVEECISAPMLHGIVTLALAHTFQLCIRNAQCSLMHRALLRAQEMNRKSHAREASQHERFAASSERFTRLRERYEREKKIVDLCKPRVLEAKELRLERDELERKCENAKKENENLKALNLRLLQQIGRKAGACHVDAGTSTDWSLPADARFEVAGGDDPFHSDGFEDEDTFATYGHDDIRLTKLLNLEHPCQLADLDMINVKALGTPLLETNQPKSDGYEAIDSISQNSREISSQNQNLEKIRAASFDQSGHPGPPGNPGSPSEPFGSPCARASDGLARSRKRGRRRSGKNASQKTWPDAWPRSARCSSAHNPVGPNGPAPPHFDQLNLENAVSDSIAACDTSANCHDVRPDELKALPWKKAVV